jgi:hypothetical protein
VRTVMVSTGGPRRIRSPLQRTRHFATFSSEADRRERRILPHRFPTEIENGARLWRTNRFAVGADGRVGTR